MDLLEGEEEENEVDDVEEGWRLRK
jgi:hypothetical protein